MKIKKLIISAFGPYAERQELDFEANLDGKNMFVITGNTGAGKTTIFDAINFALYGEASGSEREGKSLRSDFADLTTPTEVELWFSLRGKNYYIKRSPQYFRAKQRGEGFTESKPYAEIKLEDKTVSGPKEVTRLVEEILGITCEQFKQLVMIPQGEFKKLLNSDSDKKEEIFRKIFGTKIFSDIQQNIKLEANNLKKSIEVVQRDRENRIRSFSCRNDDENLINIINNKDLNIDLIMDMFKNSIIKDKEEEEILKEKLNVINDEINNISKELVLARESNKKLEDLEKYKVELEKLNLLRDEYKFKEEKLKLAKKAQTALSFEEKYEEKKKSFNRVRESLKISEANLLKYKEGLEKADLKFKEESNKEPLKNQLIKNLDEIEKLKEKSLNYLTNKEKLELLKSQSKTVAERIVIINKNIDENSSKIKILSEELDKISKLKEDSNKLKIEEINYASKEEKLDKLRSSLDKCIKESLRHEKGSNFYEETNKDYLDKKSDYEKLEDMFRRNVAGILAKELKEGERCPVCGSTNHPSLAVLEVDSVNEGAVKEAKLKTEEAYNTREKYYRELTKIKAEIDSLKNDYIKPLFTEIFNEDNVEDLNISIEKVNENIRLINEEVNKVKNKKNEMEKEISKEVEKNKEKHDIEKSNEILRSELETKNNELVIIQGEVKSQEANLDNIIKEFNGEIKTIDVLEKEEVEINKTLDKLKEDYSKAEKYFNDSKTIFDKENGNKVSLESMLKTLEEELNLSIEKFKNKVIELGFNGYKDYSESKVTGEALEVLENNINQYNIKLSNAEKIYNISVEGCKDLKFTDINSIEELLILKNNEKNKEELIEKDIYLRVNQNSKILEECKRFNKSIEADEEKYKTVGKLAKIINGDNPRKISFERYVLAAYFEDIIEAANIRFSQMTCNRFELLRKEELGDKRKGQGLDLEVFDNYTGKSRDVKTLSGGESFKASLSMALGLADVVQRYSGGIQLDTMFIDEGFGTLDPESLDAAIECLVGLQGDGRVVGVISHVQELKDRIDVKLEVVSTNKGSKAVFK
ncbi:AAA family ATPase [Clostridium nigeriense]|uniref:AAA family ATPase n=1 Tax=Clostridium nigeriense TaxID=1805470 RepID=UPI003D33FD3E